jgi:hypothetical protein
MISVLFADIALCMSAHIRPYCCIVKVFLSIPLDSITYWLCNILQFSATLASKFLIVLFASISCYLMKFVKSAYYLS